MFNSETVIVGTLKIAGISFKYDKHTHTVHVALIRGAVTRINVFSFVSY